MSEAKFTSHYSRDAEAYFERVRALCPSFAKRAVLVLPVTVFDGGVDQRRVWRVVRGVFAVALRSGAAVGNGT